MAVTEQRWAPIPGWPGYEVSDLGRVRSVDRRLPDGRSAGGVLLTPGLSVDGYLRVTLRDGSASWTVQVHALVKLAFTGPRRGRQVRHLNDDPGDNRLANLRYGTRRQNAADKVKNRTKSGAGREATGGRGEGGPEGVERYGTDVTGVIGRGFLPSNGYNGPVTPNRANRADGS